MNNILAIRNDRFGEFLLNIPALRVLKGRYPGARLTMLVDPYIQELATCIPEVDAVIPWSNNKHSFGEVFRFSQELKLKKFDLCVIFNPSQTSHLLSFLAGIPQRLGYNHKWAFLLNHKIKDEKYLGLRHEIEYNLELVKAIGAATQDKELRLTIDANVASRMAERIGKGPGAVAIHPFTSDPLKEWPLENFRELINRLVRELKMRVVLIGAGDGGFFAGGHADIQQNSVDMIGKTTLVELAALLKKCIILISADSGPVHLASAVGVPVLALFRSDLPGKTARRWGPVSPGSIVIEKNRLDDISVEEVLEKAKLMLGLERRE